MFLALEVLPLINEGEAPRLAVSEQPSLSKPVIPDCRPQYTTGMVHSPAARARGAWAKMALYGILIVHSGLLRFGTTARPQRERFGDSSLKRYRPLRLAVYRSMLGQAVFF